MLAAMRRASSRVSRLAAVRRPAGIDLIIAVGQRPPVVVADDEGSAVVVDCPGRREAARGMVFVTVADEKNRSILDGLPIGIGRLLWDASFFRLQSSAWLLLSLVRHWQRAAAS